MDLLDAVEMIDIVLDEKEHDFGISEGFGIAMITVACFSFLLSLWPMIETELDGDRQTNSIIIRNFVKIFGVSGVFLIIRLVIVFKYKKDESILSPRTSSPSYYLVLKSATSFDKRKRPTYYL